MAASFLLFAALAIAVEPATLTLRTRVLPLTTDPAHLRVEGNSLFLSGFHSGKLVIVHRTGKESVKELRLDAYEYYQKDVREIRTASGGDLVLANGKIFVGQVFQGSILVVDQATMTPVKRLPLGGEGCLAASKDGQTVYFASNHKNEFYVIDTKSYEHRTVGYPSGGRGIGCLALSPDGQRLYLGIQRGGKLPNGQQLGNGNCFLAVYDLAKQAYAGTVYLAQKRADGSGDDAIPTSLAFSPNGDRLYIGTFQSEAGVLFVDTKKLELEGNIYFSANRQNPAFSWVDPLSVAVFDRWLLVAVRHNREVAVVDRASHKVVATITHSEPVGLEHIVVHGKQVYLFAGSSALSMISQRDLARLLAGIDAKAGPVRVSLQKR